MFITGKNQKCRKNFEYPKEPAPKSAPYLDIFYNDEMSSLLSQSQIQTSSEILENRNKIHVLPLIFSCFAFFALICTL